MKLPTYFISHGGGPWPWLKKQMPGVYDNLETSLRAIAAEVGKAPEAILVLSGHWEESNFTVMTSPAPPMLYDYSGFPEFTYSIQYPAPGSPRVAHRVLELFGGAGISAGVDEKRGFDHGTFAPLAAMYPSADVPVLQLSIRGDYNVDAHLAAGRALAPLREEGVVMIGSGLSYHNLRKFGPAGRHPSHAFDEWLTAAVCSATGAERNDKLREWTSAPSAREAHPHEDHLIPLMMAAGAASDEPGERIYHEDDFFGALAVSNYRFGKPPNIDIQ